VGVKGLITYIIYTVQMWPFSYGLVSVVF